MRTIVFENPGEIDPVAICTFGVSVKDGDDPIGIFGTGLKYAIAVLLRLGQDVRIQSGETEHTFALRRATVRSKDFELVTMDDRDLGFTTHYGFKWEQWMAYRELHCNSLDEGGRTYELQMPNDGFPAPTAGTTRVIVSGDDFAKVHDLREAFLLSGAPDREIGGIEVHERSGRGLFFKGILVHEPKAERTPKYTYNFLSGVDLTEDRTAKHPSWEWGRVRNAIRMCNDEKLIQEMLVLPEGYHEQSFNYEQDMFGAATEASPEFLRAVEVLSVDRRSEINQTALALYKRLTKKPITPVAKELSVIEQKQLDRAITFCKNLGFSVDDYPIIVTESLGADILGLAARDVSCIYLSATAFDHGTKRVAGTLIEEWSHLKHQLHDMTRAMQNWLLDRLVGLGERAQGDPL